MVFVLFDHHHLLVRATARSSAVYWRHAGVPCPLRHPVSETVRELDSRRFDVEHRELNSDGGCCFAVQDRWLQMTERPTERASGSSVFDITDVKNSENARTNLKQLKRANAGFPW